MKKVWVSPVVQMSKFAANEYVAACGESKTVYKFACDAGKGAGLLGAYGIGAVVLEKNGVPGVQKGDEIVRSLYQACGETHEASTKSVFEDGYYIHLDASGLVSGKELDLDNLASTVKVDKVVVWTENGSNVHCTTNLNKNSWEIAKS